MKSDYRPCGSFTRAQSLSKPLPQRYEVPLYSHNQNSPVPLLRRVSKNEPRIQFSFCFLKPLQTSLVGSSPFRERLGSNRLPEKPRPRFDTTLARLNVYKLCVRVFVQDFFFHSAEVDEH